MKVLLLNVNCREDYPSKSAMPLAYVLLENYLNYRDPMIQVATFDYMFDEAGSTLPSDLLDYDVVGVQLTYANIHAVLELPIQKEARGTKPLIVGGGVLATALAVELCRDYELFDLIVIGEGEQPLYEITRMAAGLQSVEMIEGIVYRDKDQHIVIRPQQKPMDLDAPPFPRRTFLLNVPRHEAASSGIRIQSARGCLGACSYCANSYKNRLDRVTTKAWRGLTPKRIVEELKYLKETYGCEIFNFVDPSIEDPGKKGKERLRELCSRLLDEDLRISFKANMRTETIDPDREEDLLRLLKLAGLDVIVLGMEASTEFELKLFSKNADFPTAERFCHRLLEMDCFCIITGWIPIHPYATLESIRANYDAMADTEGMANLQMLVHCLVPLRGTNIYDRLASDGLLINHDDITSVSRFRFLDPRVQNLHKGIQEVKLHFPHVFTGFYFTFLKAYNIWARSTNRMFTANRDLGPSYMRFSNDFKTIKKHMEKDLYALRMQFLAAAQQGEDDPASYVSLAQTYFTSDIPAIETSLNNAIHQFVDSMASEGHDVSVFGWKGWGSHVFERIKM